MQLCFTGFQRTAARVAPTTLAMALLVAALLSTCETAFADTADWPYWRGPSYDGTATATGLPEDWDPEGGEGSNLLWKRDDLGGPCTPIAMNGRLYTIQRADADTFRDGERIVCVDAKTGKDIWEHRYNVWLSDVPAERVGWSSVVGDPETGNVYALGSCDIFHCLNGETGEVIWSIPLHEQFGMLSTYGGRTNFPVIHEDLVIISGIIINWGEKAKPNHRLIAMDKKSGEIIWFSGTKDLPYDTTYSAPSLVTINGQRQLILGAGDGSIWGFQPRSGKSLWKYELSRRGIFATPLVVGDQVFCSQSEENVDNNNVMGAVAGLKVVGSGSGTSVSQMWKEPAVVAGYSEPVLIDGKLYLVDDRCKMWIFDAKTGEVIVEKKAFVGSRQRSALLYADGKIYVTTENGRWAIVKPTEDGFDVLSKGRVRDCGFSASPIVADSRLYFQSTNTLFCIGNDTATQTSVSMADSMGDETPIDQDLKIATIIVTPNESLLKPGEKLPLSTRVFNANGQHLDDASNVVFSVEGPGKIEGNSYVAPADAAHTAAIITAKVGDVTGEARVRIVPPLPWKFTFDELSDPPVSWVGARYRHIIKPVDGSPALTKITTIPKGARSRAWMGPSDLTGYTIAADIRGKRMSNQLADIGLTNLGYVMDLMGQKQQIQMRTWSAQLRLSKGNDNGAIAAFPWKEDTWYRMKFRVDVQGDAPNQTALLRGKVWPRDDDEPKDWAITVKDETPNLAASPGLYGNAKVAELYLDNIEVTANDAQE
ncbi:PQQ-binding-like beta-propeller repeat protein [Stieleria marina]|uniref:Outer membrane biogenesis protein BamB n=1 Tax=Stieleria marina TaxID=1930275 RepID=A0A517NNG8_9BACT|nr:outer membrane biogenesis protein BamB [Planctomycetes bacterium K23_9]